MKESKEMLEIIHKNHKKEQKRRKEKKQRRIEIILLSLLGIAILTALHIYTEKQVKNCMADGYSENFCRYAGE